MKLFSLLGAPFLSAVPVQDFETIEELDKACRTTEENTNLCARAGSYVAAGMAVSLLCDLEAKGRLTKENLVLTWDEVVELNGWTPLSDEAVEMTLEKFPECSIKPIP